MFVTGSVAHLYNHKETAVLLYLSKNYWTGIITMSAKVVLVCYFNLRQKASFVAKWFGEGSKYYGSFQINLEK